MGLEAFYKADDPYVRGLCEKGAALAKDPTATLKSREDIVDMTRLALYDTVIYCGIYLRPRELALGRR